MEVGQTVYIRSLDVRRGVNGLEETKITKVGRKYFEVTKRWYGRFEIETMLHDGGEYNARYKAYLQPEDYEIEQELEQLKDKIRTHFRYNTSLNISQAREIVKILGLNG